MCNTHRSFPASAPLQPKTLCEEMGLGCGAHGAPESQRHCWKCVCTDGWSGARCAIEPVAALEEVVKETAGLLLPLMLALILALGVGAMAVFMRSVDFPPFPHLYSGCP